jgi:two-component system response regulator TrcR
VHRVLVVDDTDDILTLVHGVTQRMGLATVTLNNSLHFMTTFVRVKPDIIVLDIVMPNIDGIEIIHWLTDVGYAGRLIVMSGYADGDRLGRALSGAGDRMAIALLQKPFRIADLKAALSSEPAPTVVAPVHGLRCTVS